MSEIITTLHEKGTPTNEVYPNIKGENIPDSAITTPKINNSAVTTDKLSDSAVTTPKINNGAVTTPKINDGAVTSSKIVDNAVTSSKINDGAVTTTKINDGAITTSKINDGAITTSKIDDEAVSMDKLTTEVQNAIASASINKIRLRFTLKDVNNVNSSYILNLYSHSDVTPENDFEDLMYYLYNNHCIYDLMLRRSNDTVCYIDEIDFDNTNMTIYEDRAGGGTMSDYTYNGLVGNIIAEVFSL